MTRREKPFNNTKNTMNTDDSNSTEEASSLQGVDMPREKTAESGAECGRCAGCGKIANDDDGTPWKYWMELPMQSAAAVMLGLVRPIPCPTCGGSGKRHIS